MGKLYSLGSIEIMAFIAAIGRYNQNTISIKNVDLWLRDELTH